MKKSVENLDVIKIFKDRMWDAEHQKVLRHIGDELVKVRKYANERNTDADTLSQTIVWLTFSSYYAGLIPIIRIESALFLLNEFRNEYAYALITRAYIEIAARLHKGLSLWRQYNKNKKNLEEFHFGICRLIAMFRREDDPVRGIFKECTGNNGKPIGGFNVQTLIDNLEKDLPDIKKLYDYISTYAHGDFSNHMMNRKNSWLSDMKFEKSPIISGYEKYVLQLRSMAFEDLNELVQITRPLRERYDAMHQKN